MGKLILAALLVMGCMSFQQPDTNLVTSGFDSKITSITVTQHSDSVIAQKVDSTAQTIAPSDTTVGPIKLPTWLLSFIASVLAVLPAVQLVLKRIPTPTSIKIQGWLGIVLDFFTFFQPDKSTAVKPSAPPPVQNGVEKPAMKDLVNH